MIADFSPETPREAAARSRAWEYLTQSHRDLPVGYGWLSAHEREVLAGLRFEQRRRAWLLGRWTAKQLITARLPPHGRPPMARIEIGAAGHGSREVLVDGVPASLSISLSERADVALCVVGGASAALGCDVAPVEPRDEALVRDYFTARELAFVGKAPSPERELLVTLVWSAKQSALMLLREGLGADSGAVEVDVCEAGARQPWGRLLLHDEARGTVFQGWWRRLEDFVLTFAAARPFGPPLDAAERALEAAAGGRSAPRPFPGPGGPERR